MTCVSRETLLSMVITFDLASLEHYINLVRLKLQDVTFFMVMGLLHWAISCCIPCGHKECKELHNLQSA
jgi:hypothetical protein